MKVVGSFYLYVNASLTQSMTSNGVMTKALGSVDDMGCRLSSL